MKLIKVKELSGELSSYSGYGGSVLDTHKSNTGDCICRVLIAAPPNYDTTPVDIWLHSSMLVEIK